MKNLNIKLIRRFAVTCCLSLVGTIAVNAAIDRPSLSPEAQDTLSIKGDVDARILVKGLTAPDGLAIHPTTEELYVVEEDISRVSVVRDGKAVTLIDRTVNMQVGDMPEWSFTRKHPRSYWENPQIRSPEGIAFSSDGTMYLTEDIPGGRLLEFKPDAQGNYTTARPIAIPWMSRPYAWESVQVTADGRLFLAGSTAEFGPGLYFGTVLMRDAAGEWWVVDYGPFASFSALGFSKDDDILLVGEEVSGSLIWWDTYRHVEIGTIGEVLPNLESIAVMADGSILALQETQMKLADQLKGHERRSMPGRLVRINPQSQEVEEYARGFEIIESIVIHPRTGEIYVTEGNRGRILALTPKTPVNDDEYLLARSLYTKEITDGRAPRKWPEFLKPVVQELGIKTVDEKPGREQEDRDHMVEIAGSEFTLQEFAEHIPLIAGRLKLTPVEIDGDNPMEEIRFLMLYPNSSLQDSIYATPSLCLFAAKHENGDITRTKVMGNMVQRSYDWTNKRRERPKHTGTVFVPIGTASVQALGRDARVALSFIGIDMLDDYYMQLQAGHVDKGFLTVDLKEGKEKRDKYEVEFVERDVQGNIERNLVVAGFSRMQVDEYGWYKLGNAPVSSLLSMNQGAPWFNKRTRDFAAAMKKRDAQYRTVLSDEGNAYGLEPANVPQDIGQKGYTPKVVGRVGEPMMVTADHGKRSLADGEEVQEAEQSTDMKQVESDSDEQKAKQLEKLRRALQPEEQRKAREAAPNQSVEEPEQQERAEGEELKREVVDVDDVQQAWTNMIMTKVVEAWQERDF